MYKSCKEFLAIYCAGCTERGIKRQRWSATREAGDCAAPRVLMLSAGCRRDVFLPLSAIPWGRGTRRFSRQSREKREAAAEAAASAALREAQCGARAAPRRFRRSVPNKGSLHLCGKRGVLRGAGGGGDGESRGKSLPNCPYSEKCWKNTKNI